jgi:disulfide bond formation protein DsbB
MSDSLNLVVRDRAARLFIAVLVACLGILGSALYVQFGKGLDPCPWCIVQRLGFLLVGFIALIAALQRPWSVGIRVWSVLGAVAAAGGAATAVYHLWLQSDPKRAAACAGSPLERLLDASSIGDWVPPLLQYGGTCEAKAWALLGLSMPQWSLVCFVALALWMLLIPRLARR